jgi:predicted nucleic acid-binding protein
MKDLTKVLYLSYTEFRGLMLDLKEMFVNEYKEELKKQEFVNFIYENKNALLEMAKEFICSEIELMIEAYQVDGILIWYKRTDNYSRNDDYILVEIYSGEDFVDKFREEIEYYFKDLFSEEKDKNKNLEQ